MFVELNNDQRREAVNTRQRFQAWRNALDRERGFKGSMVWDETKGHEYLLRSYYDDRGRRRQKSLGRRSPETEQAKLRFETERENALAARKTLDEIIERQAAVNRALELGRVPLTAARILRSLSRHGLLGHGVRVVGTNALYAYEAACGVHIDAEVTATGDIDLLFDSRVSLRLIAAEDIPVRGLLEILKKADNSFKQTQRRYRAENDEGYFVDLIKPQLNPPWKKSRQSIGGADDLEAAEIEGLFWLENTPAFEQTVMDERGYPLTLTSPDPRAFAIHKLWLSQQLRRDPLKKARDRAQAMTVAKLVKQHLQHLPFDKDELRMLPLAVVEPAIAAFDN
jgi:hypothetical protein